jgi:transcriptional regulator with XRE-family HTH domain
MRALNLTLNPDSCAGHAFGVCYFWTVLCEVLLDWGNHMLIGDRLRTLGEAKNLSQGHLEERTGLLRCYISRVENGHTVPAVETLEKLYNALEVPLYQLCYDGEQPPRAPEKKPGKEAWGKSGKDARVLAQFQRTLQGMSEGDRQLLLGIAR